MSFNISISNALDILVDQFSNYINWALKVLRRKELPETNDPIFPILNQTVSSQTIISAVREQTIKTSFLIVCGTCNVDVFRSHTNITLFKHSYCIEYTSDWADSYIYLYLYKDRCPTGIYNKLNGSNIYYKLFEKQLLNIASLFMNLIKKWLFKYISFSIVLYNIELTFL